MTCFLGCLKFLFSFGQNSFFISLKINDHYKDHFGVSMCSEQLLDFEIVHLSEA